MTLNELVERVFEGLGEPSDLPIYVFGTKTIDEAATGWRRFVDVLNQATLELSTWKFPDGHQLRMRVNDATALFQTRTLAATLTATSPGVLSMTGLAASTSNAHKGRLVVGPNGTALVIASSYVAGVTTCFVVKTTGTFATLDAVTLHERTFVWVPVATIDPTTQTGIPYVAAEGRPLEVIDVMDLETETSLARVTKDETFYVVANTVTAPTQFVKIPQGVRLDTWPEAGRTYAVRYMRGPRVLAYNEGALEPEVPAQFHRALELMGLWWGYRRAQESTDAYAVKRDIDDFLRRVRTEYDLQDELTPGQIKFYPEGR